MRAETTIQDIDLWEVWIDYDQTDPANFGMLYVFGEIWSGPGKPLRLRKQKSAQEGVLELELPPRSAGRMSAIEVHYSEPVRNLNQYHRIRIFSGSELLLDAEDIEVLI